MKERVGRREGEEERGRGEGGRGKEGGGRETEK